MLARCIQKVVLDTTGFVHLRNPIDAGGFYYCLNALMTHVACFVAAALYSAFSTGDAADDKSYSATGGNHTGANATNATVASITATRLADGTVADYAGKIDTVTLFAFIVTLSAVWAVAFAGLLLTMNRKYIGTFVSLQTGCAYAQSQFIDHSGHDERRIAIFFYNERQWRSIRDLVRQWALGAYAMWLQLSPAWFTNAVRSLIPDDFMPATEVQQLDARAPGGRRPTIANIGGLRRMSLAFSGAEDASGSDGRPSGGGHFAADTGAAQPSPAQPSQAKPSQAKPSHLEAEPSRA